MIHSNFVKKKVWLDDSWLDIDLRPVLVGQLPRVLPLVMREDLDSDLLPTMISFLSAAIASSTKFNGELLPVEEGLPRPNDVVLCPCDNPQVALHVMICLKVQS